VQCWLRGQGPAPELVVGNDRSPVWTRVFAAPVPPCEIVGSVLGRLEVERMVVGHTAQLRGIKSRCGGKLWLIDVGMAEYYGGKPAALVIDGKQVDSTSR
jgi:hypothetical protein